MKQGKKKGNNVHNLWKNNQKLLAQIYQDQANSQTRNLFVSLTKLIHLQI